MAVTFTSYGYDTVPGAGLEELVWQEMFPQIGTSYGVRNPTDWKVTAVSGADRTVSIAAGRGYGHGVIDKTVANETLQLGVIDSGSRWDLIATRRDPTPTAGVSSFIIIAGGPTPVIPGARLAGPGIHDQPLALVQVTAGQTQPTGIIDLRTWAGDGGGIVGAHDLVRSYMNATGTRIHIDGIDWLRRVGPNDIPEWYAVGAPTTYTPIQVGGYALTGAITSKPAGDKRQITVDITVKRTGADITITTAFAGFGQILPDAVQGDSLPKYLPVSLSGGDSPGNNNHATIGIFPVDGSMSVKGLSSFTWNKNAVFSLNFVYYI
jgi:hypothetical protein